MDTPRYEYSRRAIQQRLSELSGLSAPFGLTVRYAVKANPHPEILQMLHDGGIHFDASSSYEAALLLTLGIPGERISLSSQQSAHDLDSLLGAGVQYVATSISQLQAFLASPAHPPTVGVRINPAMGFGHNNRTSTGGPNASFGIWHAYGDQVRDVARAHGVTIDRLHIHVGSGADPAVWQGVLERALELVTEFEQVTSLDIGGGFKVHRYDAEPETDLSAILSQFSEQLLDFKARTGRMLRLEIEPGTYTIAHAGTLVAQVDDIVDTGPDGHTFLRLNTGMNDFLRSALYGAQHEIEVINDSAATREYVVVGHNCESGDLLTPAPGNPEELGPRTLKEARIGDEVRIYDAGAYCASMRAKGYNAFPDAIEVMVD